MDLVTAFLSAGIGAGLMTIIQMIINRKWAKEDKDEAKDDKIEELSKSLVQIGAKLDTLNNEVGHIKLADQAILSDRIKWLGTQYLRDGEIEFEDRRNLHRLHEAYHKHCGGNGDFDILMHDVDELPLKRK